MLYSYLAIFFMTFSSLNLLLLRSTTWYDFIATSVDIQASLIVFEWGIIVILFKVELKPYKSSSPSKSYAFIDDDYQLEEYYTSLKQEEVQANHDAWWNSLTEEQKQKLYEEQEAYEKDRINNDMNGPNSQYGV